MGASNIALTLDPGTVVKIICPVVRGESGCQVRTGSMYVNGELKELTRGFVVLDDEVGSIRVTKQEEAAVLYTHKKKMRNEIWFFALTGETAVIDVVNVPIHDHSSLITGGPSLSVYSSEFHEEATEE